MTSVGGFPPTNGGRIDGFNDPGIAHFTGAPLASLAREIIQNSLDASLAPDEPVHVSFEMIYLDPGNFGQDDLAIAIDASRQMAGDDPLASGALTAAAESIRLNVIPCLRVSDRNTTGLRGDQWRALVKMQGVSQKPGNGRRRRIARYRKVRTLCRLYPADSVLLDLFPGGWKGRGRSSKESRY